MQFQMRHEQLHAKLGDAERALGAEQNARVEEQHRASVSMEEMWLGPPVVPFCPFLEEGSPIKIDYRKKGTVILTSLLEDLGGKRRGAKWNPVLFIGTSRPKKVVSPRTN